MTTLAEIGARLNVGETTSRALVTEALERIASAGEEGRRTFLATTPDASFAAADAVDRQRAKGAALSPLAGIPVSIKALFDVAGLVTTAGSTVLADQPPARDDAEIVQRLRAAGMIVIGHTNMTEFAYSGLGMNPHYGTPANPADPTTPRIPGGSSSGAATSVARGMVPAAIGTDTGGSCRIPASFCGLVGFKPTARRVPMAGTFPLSHSFDSVGPLVRTVTCAGAIDAVLVGDRAPDLAAPEPDALRFAVLDNFANEGVSDAVAQAFEETLRLLGAAGVRIERLVLPDLEQLPELNARGGIVAAEAYAVHAEMLERDGGRYDPRVSVRILKAREQRPGEYEALISARTEMIARAAAATLPFDAVLFPTTPMTAPSMAELAEEDAYGKANLLALRNPTIANFLDRCAISVPMPVGGGLPAGLNLMGATMGDRALLAVARAVEAVLGDAG